jgi:monoamine oxidase
MTTNAMSRRHLLTLIGTNLGAAAMMQGMGTLGFAATSTYAGPISLDGAPKGTRILVLGAGMAGLVAAFELRNAGYHVQVLEYNNRAGGRAWTVRGGDRYTECATPIRPPGPNGTRTRIGWCAPSRSRF